jgi:exopolyphosphatase/guanosine-5'-triphosphate,3'-diphosphate pyrophosphatase
MADAAAAQPERAHRGSGPAFAALDLGTNNCRLLVGAPTHEGFRVLDSFSRIVRLGEGLQGSGQLSPAAMDRAMEALHGCAARLARRPVRAVRAIATEACRRAGNGPQFLARVQAETGLRFDVISTREEAELALESCGPLLRGAGRRALLFDIGGGSTELAWVRLPGPADPGDGVPELIGYASLPVGVVTLSEQFGADAFTSTGFAGMVDAVAARLLPFERTHCIGHEARSGGVRMLGTSGTVTTLAGVALGLDRYRRPLIDGTTLSPADADRSLATVQGLGRAGLAMHPCVGADRADFVLPGCAIFEAIRRLWPLGPVIVADRGLREGMLLRLMRRQAGRQPHRRESPFRPDAPTCLPA